MKKNNISLDMFEFGPSKSEVAKALAIPEDKVEATILELRKQSSELKEFENLLGTQNLRIKYKILQDLESKIDSNMLEPSDLLKFLSLLDKQSVANQSERGGLAEHLEAMYEAKVKEEATKIVEDGKKFRNMKDGAIEVVPTETDEKQMPHI